MAKMVDAEKLLARLTKQRDDAQAAIAVLIQTMNNEFPGWQTQSHGAMSAKAKAGQTAAPKKRHLSAESRAKLSAAARKRWAGKKKT